MSRQTLNTAIHEELASNVFTEHLPRSLKSNATSGKPQLGRGNKLHGQTMEDILLLLQAGVQQTRIARHYDVSPPAISYQIKDMPLPVMTVDEILTLIKEGYKTHTGQAIRRRLLLVKHDLEEQQLEEQLIHHREMGATL